MVNYKEYLNAFQKVETGQMTIFSHQLIYK